MPLWRPLREGCDEAKKTRVFACAWQAAIPKRALRAPPFTAQVDSRRGLRPLTFLRETSLVPHLLGMPYTRSARAHPAFAITFKNSYTPTQQEFAHTVSLQHGAAGTLTTEGSSCPAMVSPYSPLARDLSC